ncbi:MAG TPA: DUF5615 family PIN-like protein [Candidatus Kapabacteria bacterium]
MIIADENISSSLIKALRENGFEVVSVKEEFSGMGDKDILKMSLQPPPIILTEDKDFGDLIFSEHQESVGVVFLRYEYIDRHVMNDRTCTLFKNQSDSLIGKFTTITTKKTRSRDL